MNASTFEFNNVMIEQVTEKTSTQVQSMQLHKLLDINDEEKLNETKYEVRIVDDILFKV